VKRLVLIGAMGLMGGCAPRVIVPPIKHTAECETVATGALVELECYRKTDDGADTYFVDSCISVQACRDRWEARGPKPKPMRPYYRSDYTCRVKSTHESWRGE
jgi:hypothetical protein